MSDDLKGANWARCYTRRWLLSERPKRQQQHSKRKKYSTRDFFHWPTVDQLKAGGIGEVPDRVDFAIVEITEKLQITMAVILQQILQNSIHGRFVQSNRISNSLLGVTS